MITVGILSDTHLGHCTDIFLKNVRRAFADCTVIIHAGDLTDISIFEAFEGKIVHAVHGNMCNTHVQQALPHNKLITLEGIHIGICHGAGLRSTIEDRVWQLFPEADCIVYGHTHHPVCERKGGVLFINPGSFHSSGPYGAPATYALLQIDNSDIKASIHSLAFGK